MWRAAQLRLGVDCQALGLLYCWSRCWVGGWGEPYDSLQQHAAMRVRWHMLGHAAKVDVCGCCGPLDCLQLAFDCFLCLRVCGHTLPVKVHPWEQCATFCMPASSAMFIKTAICSISANKGSNTRAANNLKAGVV